MIAYPLILTVDAAQVAGYRQWALNLVSGLCSRETVPNLATCPWQDFGELSTALSLCFSGGGGGCSGEVSVIIPHSSLCFLLGRDKVRALTSNCSLHCILKWLTETFSSMFCVCAFFFYLFAPIAMFLIHKLSSMEILTLKLYWVHILLAYSLHSRHIVVVAAEIKPRQSHYHPPQFL